MSTNSHLHISEWLGMAFFYCWHRGRKSMKEIGAEEYKWRNIWVGHVVKIILVCLVIYLVLIRHYV